MRCVEYDNNTNSAKKYTYELNTCNICIKVDRFEWNEQDDKISTDKAVKRHEMLAHIDAMLEDKKQINKTVN